MTPQTQTLLQQAAAALTRNDLGQVEFVSQKALQLDKTCHQASFFLAQVESKRGNRNQSERYVRYALTVDPKNPRYQMALATTLLANHQLDEGVTLLEQALERQPGNFLAHHHLATGLASLGRLDDAIAHYETTIDLRPTFAAAHYQLATLKQFSEDDQQIAQLQSLLAKPNEFRPREYSQLCFALAKGLEQIHDFDAAFEAYVKGNEARKRLVNFDIDAHELVMKEIAESFDEAFFSEVLPLRSTTNPKPIFVVGMPRSGSTLVEQIVSNHPQIEGLGELPVLPNLINKAMNKLPYPSGVRSVSSEDWSDVMVQYISQLHTKADGVDTVTDKQLFNFKHLWLVFKYLPNARVIYCCRNAMDTCWSCYTTAFKNDLGFSNDLETTARMYRATEKLMDHWIHLFPDRIYRVDYEDLVQDTQSQARELIEFTGKTWIDECLDFHTNPKQVTTSSVAQVRKPIYKTSVGKWRRFRKKLKPLREFLS